MISSRIFLKGAVATAVGLILPWELVQAERYFDDDDSNQNPDLMRLLIKGGSGRRWILG